VGIRRRHDRVRRLSRQSQKLFAWLDRIELSGHKQDSCKPRSTSPSYRKFFALPFIAPPRRVGVDVPGGHEANDDAIDVQLVEQENMPAPAPDRRFRKTFFQRLHRFKQGLH
jgi:hypothetical protein